MFAGIGVDQVAPERMTSSATRLLLSPMPIVPARERHRDGIGQPVARRLVLQVKRPLIAKSRRARASGDEARKV